MDNPSANIRQVMISLKENIQKYTEAKSVEEIELILLNMGINDDSLSR